MGEKQVSRDQETLGCGIHVNLTITTYLSIAADQVHPFMATVFPNSRGHIQQDIVQEWFKEQSNEFSIPNISI